MEEKEKKELEKRKKKLLKIFKNVGEEGEMVTPLIDDILHIEYHLKNLRQLPFYEINKENTRQQRVTPISKLYKELLQQYNNSIKVLYSVYNKGVDEEESPLREFLKLRDK